MFDYEYWGNEVLPAKTNMMLEEFMLRRPALYPNACVRFFSVPKDAVVLGYAQDTDAIKKQDNTFDVTRRLTGGSHVQLGQNILAYSFSVPRDGSFRNYEDMRAYYAQHVADAFEDLGIENITVDNKASTINVDGRVVASHAAIWGVESALLHGLIIVSSYDMEKLSERVFLGQRKIGGKVYTEQAAIKNMPALSKFLDERKRKLANDLIANAILARVTRGKYRKMRFDKKTLESCQTIEKKHASERWVAERRPPFEEDQIEEIPGEQLNGKLKKNMGYCMYLQVKDKHFKKMSGPKE